MNLHFLEPWGLVGLAALAPIIALYFLKLRREERVVPSTLLWKKVIEDMQVNAPFQRLRYSLILLLQLLMIAVLAFALSRPFLDLPGMQSKHLILLVDTSASMATRDSGKEGKQSRLEAAVQDAMIKIDDLPRGGEIRLVAFDEEVRSLSPFTSDKAELKKLLLELKPRDLRSRPQEAFEAVLAMSEERTDCEIPVFSDGAFGALDQARLMGGDSGANIEETSRVRLKKLKFIPYGKNETDNVGITNISARTRLIRAFDEKGETTDALETQIFVMVENFSQKDKDVILTFSTADTRFPPQVLKMKGRPADVLPGSVPGGTEAAGAKILDESRMQKVFRLPLGIKGTVTAKIDSPKDSFPLDDQASVVVGTSEGTKALWITKGNYFLEKSLTVMRDVLVTKITPEDFDKDYKTRGRAAVDDYDTVIFDDVPTIPWEDGGAIFWNRLPPIKGFAKRVDESKKAAPAPVPVPVPAPAPTNPPGPNPVPAPAPAAPPAEEKAIILESPKVLDTDVGHPVMRYVGFNNIQVVKAEAWQIPKTASMLVEAQGGPLISAYETDRIRAVGLSFNLYDTDWAYRPSLVVFLRNSVNWCAEVSPRRRPASQATGVPLTIPPIKDVAKATLMFPNGNSKEIDVSPDVKSFAKVTETQGIYKLTGLPNSPDADRLYAVNLCDPVESDVRVHPNLSIGTEKVEAQPALIIAKREIWHYLALAAGAILLLEWLIYHRRLGI